MAAALTPTMKRLQVDAAALTPMSTGSRKRTPLGTPPVRATTRAVFWGRRRRQRCRQGPLACCILLLTQLPPCFTLPQSVLTPNDDAAEKAEVRRRR